MKEFWIQINQDVSVQKRNELIKLASQVCDVISIVKEAENIREIELFKSKISDELVLLDCFDKAEVLRLKNDGKKVAVRISIHSKEDEAEVVKAAKLKVDYIMINCLDWKIIPLENLIAKTRGKTKLIAEVANAEEAKVALETLELGTEGVLLKTSDPNELLKTADLFKSHPPKIELVTAEVVSVKPISTGARACVDTCDLMKPGEGMLVGCQSAGLFLVEAEVHESPYVQSRPFRVNAGSLSLYTLTSLRKTRYLSELKAGDEVLIIDRKGNFRVTNVGRVKIEFRPLLLIEAIVGNKKVKAILQNAETIRVVTSNSSKSVTELKSRDQVLVYMAPEGGRHFGISVPDETVMER